MTEPKVGLITFGDNREHEWEHVFKDMTETRHQLAIEYFKTVPVELHAADKVARHKDEIDDQVDALLVAGVESFIAHTPCWTSPNLVVRGIQGIELPTVVLTNTSPATHGTVGFLGACGTLDQIGYPHLRIRENFEGESVAEKSLAYFRASMAKKQLRGQVFGLFGGRSLGIDTGTFDPLQWKRMFGVDTEHIDQLEIIRRADLVPENQTTHMVSWLEKNVAQVDYGEGKLTREKLAFQVRCYLATKEIIGEKKLDFIAVKCMPDLTTHFVPQCISAALMPGPYDADGPKDPMMMSCEADGDGALSMEILKQVSGGKPVLFMDVSYIDDEAQVFYLPNCGAFCSWYAKRSDDPAENLKQVKLHPANRPGGGAITYFNPSPGPLTFARLYRKRGEYYMAILSGETIELPPEKHEAFVQARGSHQLPTAFANIDVDIDVFMNEFASNHILAVDGTYVRELAYFCKMMDITPMMYNRGVDL
jgi:L-fucose isomerase